MSVRHLMFDLLRGNAPVVAVFGNRIIDEGALGETAGAQPAFPYLVTKYAEITPGVSRTTHVHSVELWAYDTPTDYTRIDKGLAAAYDLLHERAGDAAVRVGEPTTHLMDCRWQSTSRGLRDDVLRASVRYASYTVVTNTP